MSFGIEFDIDDGMPEEQSVTGVPDTHVPPESPDVGRRAEKSDSGETGMQEHRFDRLFALTRSLREQDRKRWLRHYADMRVDDGMPGYVADECDEEKHVHRVQDEHASLQTANDNINTSVRYQHDAGNDERERDAGKAGDAVRKDNDGAPNTDDAHAEGATPETPMVNDFRSDAHVTGDEYGNDQSTCEERTETPFEDEDSGASKRRDSIGVLSLFAVALSFLSVIGALVPVMGRVLWVPPAVITVLVAVPTLVCAYLKNKPIALALVAIFVTALAMGVSSVANQIYASTGIIATSGNESAPAISAGNSLEPSERARG